MSIPVCIIVMSTFAVILFKCLKHEEELIELEDKIIEDVRDFIKQTKKKRNFKVVKKSASKNRSAKNCMTSKRRNDTAA